MKLLPSAPGSIKSQWLVCTALLALALSSIAIAQQPFDRSQLQKIVALPDKPPAPAFSLVDRQGEQHALSDYRGKVVIVNFWATWCAPCRKEMPSMQRAWEQMRNQDVMLLAVNWGDTETAVAKFFKKLSVDFPVLLGGDREMTNAWSVRGLPTTFVLDPEGRIAYRIAGEMEWDEPELIDKILALHTP